MALSQADRQSFSLYIVQADQQIASIAQSQAQVSAQVAKLQGLDDANNNLLIPTNTLINGYQSEFKYLDGNVRSVVTEQDIKDAANKKLRNFFFPNDTAATIPALSSTNNVWTQIPPFALSYGVGLNYTQGYSSTIQSEQALINAIIVLINSASSHVDIENTSGQQFTTGSCSLSQYTDQATCELNLGVWTPGVLQSFPAVVTLKTNLVNSVNSLVSLLGSESAAIVTNDPNSTNQTQNNAALSNISGIIQPALSTWLAYPDFNPVPGTVTTYSAFYAYDPSLLAPTKLHSVELNTLKTALNNRLSFLTTRIAQVNTVLGTIAQDVTNGNITSSSGLYGKRFNFLSLRLNSLNGSLTQVNSLKNASGAQTSVSSSIAQNKSTYLSILPTSLFQSPANGTARISLSNASLFSPGDSVFISADNQPELQRAVKSITGNSVLLNDVIPAKYTPSSNARLYKDIS